MLPQAGPTSDWTSSLADQCDITQIDAAKLQKELEAMPGYGKYGPGNVPIIGEGKEAQRSAELPATPAMEKPVYAPPTGQVAPPNRTAAAPALEERQTVSVDEAIAHGHS